MSDLRFFIICIAGLSITSLFLCYNVYGQSNSAYDVPSNSTDYLTVISNTEGNEQTLRLPISSLLFNVIPHNDENGRLVSFSLKLKPDLVYSDLGFFDKPPTSVFIYPSFTQAAYGKDGFYDFYNNKCDSKCLTVKIPDGVHGVQASSIAGAWALKLLNYPYIKDEDVDKNPDILKQYKRVIVLHNEYVTKKEFDAITSHPDVIFLYPNALYAEVKTNYTDNTITLVHGHGYPDQRIKNGFDWTPDNSKFEYNINCNDWYFYKVKNYTMLNCYPEYKILSADQLLRSLLEDDPSDLLDDINDWLRYHDQYYTTQLLDDFNVKGKHIPSWVRTPAEWTMNNEITKSEFARLIIFLANKNMLN